MSLVDTSSELLSTSQPVGPTGPTPDDALGSCPALDDRQEAWQRIIDKYLIEWGRGPNLAASEDIAPPTPLAIEVGCALAVALRDAGDAAPHRVVPDGEGGLSFEHRAGRLFQSLNVEGDGRVELLTFRDGDLTWQAF